MWEEPCFSLLSLIQRSQQDPWTPWILQISLCDLQSCPQVWYIERIFATQLSPVSYLAWDPPWANILRACALIYKRGKRCSVCGIKGTGHFLEFFALQKNASAKVFRFPLALEMAVPVLTSPWSMCRAPAAAPLFMLLYFKGGLSTGVLSPVPKSNAKR